MIKRLIAWYRNNIILCHTSSDIRNLNLPESCQIESLPPVRSTVQPFFSSSVLPKATTPRPRKKSTRPNSSHFLNTGKTNTPRVADTAIDDEDIIEVDFSGVDNSDEEHSLYHPITSEVIVVPSSESFYGYSVDVGRHDDTNNIVDISDYDDDAQMGRDRKNRRHENNAACIYRLTSHSSILIVLHSLLTIILIRGNLQTP